MPGLHAQRKFTYSATRDAVLESWLFPDSSYHSVGWIVLSTFIKIATCGVALCFLGVPETERGASVA